MAAQYGLDVIYVVVDNAGWQSIRDLQLDVYGEERGFAAEFRRPDGETISPDLVMVARGFGVQAEEATDEQALKGAIGRALATGGPTVIVVPVRREFPESAGPTSGWAWTSRSRPHWPSAARPTKGRWHRSDETL